MLLDTLSVADQQRLEQLRRQQNPAKYAEVERPQLQLEIEPEDSTPENIEAAVEHYCEDVAAGCTVDFSI
jgi:serine kinase of HPr protein (carbohydrate metabolism regulator)